MCGRMIAYARILPSPDAEPNETPFDDMIKNGLLTLEGDFRQFEHRPSRREVNRAVDAKFNNFLKTMEENGVELPENLDVDAMRERLFGLMRQQIAEGRQVYVVYPLIRESEKMENLKDLQDGYESITRAFPPPHYVTVVVHGQMSADDKDFGMNLFASGRAHIMVATTVIEVGVNVPNATVMVIESAERFGLSQLHQLRGRVGRGADESYCVLMTSTKLSADSRRRMDTMVATNDGFRIAEVDLQLRGPGDIEGTLQSGTPFDLRLASITADAPLMQRARQTAQTVLDTDPLLQLPHHAAMATHLNTLAIKRTDFGGIS